MKSATTTPSLAEATRAGQDTIAAIGRLRRVIRQISADDALSAPQTSALGLLGKNGAATASALAATEGVRPQSMATTLAALERQGLIERHADPHDGRRQVVTLSAAGEAAFHGSRTARNDWLTQRIRSTLSPDETQLLIDAAALIERLAQLA